MKISKNHELGLLPGTSDEIAQVRERCRRAVRKRAAISAGIAAIPVPGVDILADLTAFATMVEEINQSFGLTPQQIERLQPRLRIVAYEAAASLGGMLVGKLITRELVFHLFKKSGFKLAAKTTAKMVPLAGQVASAAIGFALFRQMGYQHVEACVKVAEEVGRVGSSTGV
jgi:uncharacterized protein (DUF697 family)